MNISQIYLILHQMSSKNYEIFWRGGREVKTGQKRIAKCFNAHCDLANAKSLRNFVQIIEIILACAIKELVCKSTSHCKKSNTSLEIKTAAKGAPIAHTVSLSMHSWNRFFSMPRN